MCCFEGLFNKTLWIFIFFRHDFLNMTIPFNHPFMMTAIGPSQSGKSYWIYRLLCSLEILVTPVPKHMIDLYGTECQKSFDNVKDVLEDKKKSSFIPGYDFIQCMTEIPMVDDLKKFLYGNDDILFILDDSMFLASDDKESFV